MPYVCASGALGTITVREKLPYLTTFEPITRRAWTFQERLLSPRLLIYGKRLMWQCNSAQHSDGGVEDWSYDRVGTGQNRLAPVLASSDPPNLSLFSLQQLYKTWYDGVHEYSRRELTFPQDKLPSIAGVANEFYRLTGDDYLAGLWRNNLLHDLMWYTWDTIPLSKPSIWRAPSWSWASVDNPVIYGKIAEDSTPMSKVLSCNVVPLARIARFSQVTSGILEISGPLKRIDWPHIQAIRDRPKAPPPKGSAADWNKELINMILDMPHDENKNSQEWSPPASAWCLILFRHRWHWDSYYEQEKIWEMGWSGLILDRKEDRTFERIGAFFNERGSWFGDWERERVTIL